MIWGLALEPGNEYTRTSEDDIHLSLAAIESRADDEYVRKTGSYSQVVLRTEDSEQLLCTLVYGTIFQQCLDLKLMAGEKVTFSVQGSCTVYITGYSFRSPLEPASNVGDLEERTEASNMTYGDSTSSIKTEPDISDEDNIKEEQTIKEEEELRQETDDGGKQGLADDGFLLDDQQNDEVTTHSGHSHSSDVVPSGDHVTSEQILQGEVKTEDLSDEMNPADEMQIDVKKETSLPRPSTITAAQTRSMIQSGSSFDVHCGENGSSREKDVNIESSREGSSSSSSSEMPTTDTSNRAKKVPTTAIARKVAGSSTDSKARSVSDPSGQRSKVIESPPFMVPASQPSPGVSKQLTSPEDKYICPLCSQVFPGKDSLLAHEQKHAQEGKMFSCRYCHMVFLQKGNRNIHERIHSAMRHNFRAAFKNQSDLKEKSRKASLDDVMQEGKVSKADVPKLPVTAPPPPPPLQRHKPSHSHRRSRPYPHYSGLGLRAAQQPVEEKNYKCQFCDKPFKRNYDRNRHERIHTGQKPYECSYCNQAFSRREHCKKHEFSHLRARQSEELSK